MKLLKQVAIAAAVIATSASAYAQTVGQPSDPATRAEVKQDLMNVESAGYEPGAGDRTTYPKEAQAAERRVSQQQGQTEGYGGVASGTTSMGATAQPMQRNNDGTKGVYFGQ